MTHSWCHDIARDAAVRAAEDNRTEPLPTLGEAIARPFAEAAERSVPVSKTGEGQSGMRTERVTLEERITLEFSFHHRSNFRPKEWAATFLPGAVCQGISVRVVSDEEPIPPAPVSRPAETRQTKAERVGSGWWFPKYDKPSAPPPPPPAPPRVHRGSGVFDASGDELPWEGVVAILTAERDAAIRERESWKLLADRTNERLSAAEARVAELEAASGGGEGAVANVTFHVDDSAERARYVGMTVKPLRRPQPRGWLTEEERTTLTGVVGLLRDIAKVSGRHTADRCELTAVAINALLARSSPPEVVLRSWTETNYANRVMSAEEVIAALAAAGVAVKEVGRD